MKHNMSIKDTHRLKSILEAISKISKYTGRFQNQDDFYNDEEAFDASLMNFIIIGEMVSKLSDDFKNIHNQTDWNRIKDFRNLVAHDYIGIDAEEVWQIITNDLPKLETDILGMLKA